MQTHKTFQQDLYEGIKGKACKEKFSVPKVICAACQAAQNNLSPTEQSAQIISTVQPRAAQERKDYEKNFFGNLIGQQISNARCAQSYLSALDQRPSIPFDSGLAHITDDPCSNTNSPGYRAQKDILENKIYPYMGVFHDASEKLKEAERKYNSAKKLRNEINRDAEDEKNREFAAYNDLVLKKTALENIQSKIWNGTNSHVLEFIEDHYKDGRSKEQFAKYFGDCNNRESFQTNTLQAMQKDNANIITRDSSALEEFQGKKQGWSLARSLGLSDDPLELAKTQLVHSGVALSYLNGQQKKPDEFKDFACYLEGSYGEGRDYIVHTRQGAIAATATLLTFGEDLPILIGGMALAAGLSGLELADNCSTDSEIGGAVNADVCTQVRAYNQKKTKPADGAVAIVNSDVQSRAGCFSTVTDTALNLIPAVAELKMGLKAKEIIQAERLAREAESTAADTRELSVARASTGNVVNSTIESSAGKVQWDAQSDGRKIFSQYVNGNDGVYSPKLGGNITGKPYFAITGASGAPTRFGSSIGEREIEDFIRAHEEILKNPKYGVTLYRDHLTGEITMEIVEIVPGNSQRAALEAAKIHGQTTIYDLQNGRDVEISPPINRKIGKNNLQSESKISVNGIQDTCPPCGNEFHFTNQTAEHVSEHFLAPGMDPVFIQEDAKTIARARRSTSVFSSDVSMQEVVEALKKPTSLTPDEGTRILLSKATEQRTDLGAVLNTQNNKSIGFEAWVDIKGQKNKIRFYVCEARECLAANGKIFAKDEVISVFPICGPTVLSIPNLKGVTTKWGKSDGRVKVQNCK